MKKCDTQFLYNYVQVLNTEDDKHWFKAEQDGKDGLIPENYIQLKPHEYVNDCYVFYIYVNDRYVFTCESSRFGQFPLVGVQYM